jgi:hypothetical protein
MGQLTRWLRLGGVALALIVMAACGAAAPATAPLPEVVITAEEYSFSGPESIPGGWTKVVLDNRGAKAHDLILFRLDEGKSMDDVMAALESGAAEQGPPDWLTLIGQSTAGAGERKMFIAELAPGSYGMISFGEEESGPPDVAQGMVKGMTVTEAPAAPVALPQADATIEMLDFSYAVSGLSAGAQLIQVANKGAEDHEAVFFRINEGKTFEDVRALLALPEEEQQEQQFMEVVSEAGAVTAAAGQTVYVEQELAPGSYALICFLPSPANGGAPHFALGMAQEVVVE